MRERLVRVLVVGTSGAGKTALASRLASRLDCPHVELDALYWGKEWTPRPRDAFLGSLRTAVAGERWVIDGNYQNYAEITWPRATTVVWLDYPLPVVFFRMLRRTVRRAATREPLFNGNRETWRLSFFSRRSILLWTLTSFAPNRRRYRERLLASADVPRHVVHLRLPRDTERWMSSIDTT